MFSKVGKVSENNFAIFKQKNEILSGKTRKIKVKSPLRRPKKPEISQKQIQDLLKNISSYESLAKKKEDKSAVFKAQSRNDFYKATAKREASPPTGHYDASYNLVTKAVRVANFSLKRKNKRRVSPQATPHRFSSPEPPRRHIASPLFDRQLARNPFQPRNSSEIRSSKIPDNYSNYKRILTPDFSKFSERKFEPQEKMNLSYSPKYKLVSEDLGKVADFSKYSSRKPFYHKSYQVDYKLNTPKNSKVPDFEKTFSRPGTASPLPSYFFRLKSKSTKDSINQKMLLTSIFKKD